MLKRQEMILTWDARQIVPGTNRAKVVDKRLEEASIILLLVSTDFLASDDYYKIEMNQVLERHKEGQVRVIPIIVRPCDWHYAFFAHLQCLPRNGKAITTWVNRDQAWNDVIIGIREAIEDLHQGNISVQSRQKTESEHKQELNERLPRTDSPPVVMPPQAVKPPPSFHWSLMLLLPLLLFVVVAVLGGFWLTQHNIKRSADPSSSQKTSININVTITATAIPTLSISPVVPAAQRAQQVLSQFCTDLRKGNYPDAYRLINSYQHTLYGTVNQFKQSWVNLNIKGSNLNSNDCIATDFHHPNIDTYTGVITLPRVDNPNPAHELVVIDDKDETGTWKVSDWKTAL
jgi:TIR domain